MNLYTFIQVEPVSSAEHNQLQVTDAFLPLGNFPGIKTTGHWHEQQTKLIHDIAMHWFNAAPACATDDYRQQRKRIIKQLEQQDYNFVFEFHSSDAISLACYQADNNALFELLKDACKNTNICITRFGSI